MSDPHEDPANEYEAMLDANDLDCAIAGCWEPVRARIDIGGELFGVCLQHAANHAIVQWLES